MVHGGTKNKPIKDYLGHRWCVDEVSTHKPGEGDPTEFFAWEYFKSHSLKTKPAATTKEPRHFYPAIIFQGHGPSQPWIMLTLSCASKEQKFFENCPFHEFWPALWSNAGPQKSMKLCGGLESRSLLHALFA